MTQSMIHNYLSVTTAKMSTAADLTRAVYQQETPSNATDSAAQGTTAAPTETAAATSTPASTTTPETTTQAVTQTLTESSQATATAQQTTTANASAGGSLPVGTPATAAQSGGGGIAYDILSMAGLEGLANSIGGIPALLLVVATIAVVAVLMVGGKDAISKITQIISVPAIGLGIFGRGSSSGESGSSRAGSDGDGDTEALEEASEDIVTEAANRLRQEGNEVTGQALDEKIEEIEREKEKAERESRTGAVQDPEERGEMARMALSPEKIEESETYTKRVGEHGATTYARTIIISNYPSRVSFGWLDRLFTSGLEKDSAEVRVSYHINPRDTETMMKKLNVRATRLTSRISKKKSEGKVNTNEEEEQLKHVNRLREGLTKGNTKLFDFSLYIEVSADTKQKLDEATQEVKQILAQSNAKAVPLYDRQVQSMRSMAPLADDAVRKTHVMDLQSLGTTFPFIEPSAVMPTGVLMGFHKVTNSPVVVDRFELSGHNMLVSGKIGSGKSYLSKLVIWRRLMMDPETEVLIIDPVGGFGDLVGAVGGQRVTIDNDTIINPLEIKEVENEDALEEMEGHPYDDKLRSVMGVFKAHFQGRLKKEEEGVLRRAVRFAYLEKGITRDIDTHGNTSPTVQDVMDILQKMGNGGQPSEFLDVSSELLPQVERLEMESLEGVTDMNENTRERLAGHAHSVWLGMEDFQPGGQRANLNGHTNVELDARTVQFDLSNVADSESQLMMQIVLDWLFQRAKTNTGQTMVTIDEAHYLLKQKQALDLLNLFARHSRHYGAGMTLISQTVDEFMEKEGDPDSAKKKEIYDQCDIRALMRHEDIGEDAMKALDLSKRERDFVLQAQAGNSADFSEGLLYVTGIGKMRLRILSNAFEHHVVDQDVNAWAFLYENKMCEWNEIPPTEQPEVKAILERQHTNNAAAD